MADRSVPAALRRTAVVVAVLRYAIPLAAIPLIPLLLRDQLIVLVALRPTKDLLLLGGGQARVTGSPGLWWLLLAYVPLMVVAVWAFFVVGRAYRRPLVAGSGGPAWLHRAIPPERLELASRILARRGATIVVLGRLAALPPTVLAAAAGVSDLPARRYLGADLVGAFAAFVATVGAGFALGHAYERGGLAVTVFGVALVVALIALLTRWLREEASRTPPAAPPTERPMTEPSSGGQH